MKIGGQAVKPSHEVRLEEVLTVQLDVLQRTLRVTGFSERRVGAPIARALVEDLTSPEEQERARTERAKLNQGRLAGTGRPTKRERRLWERWTMRPESPET